MKGRLVSGVAPSREPWLHSGPPVRYLKVTLFIAFIVSLFVASLYELGLLYQLDLALAGMLGLHAPPVFTDRAWQYPLIIGSALAVAWATVDIPRKSLKCVVAGLAFLEVIAAAWIAQMFGSFYSPFATLFSIALSFTGAFIYARTEGGMRKNIVSSLFGDRVSKGMFATLVNADHPLTFEGEVTEASIIVCEIFNHQELTEQVKVSDYVALQNSFLKNASDFLVERGGYLDKSDGESLRVIFGAPLPDPGHASTACEAALALARRLDEVNRECFQVWKQMFDFRIGVNSGEMVVAAYGSGRLGNFSVAGEPVEYARRLCAANTIYGSRILVGCQTFFDAESDVEVRPMELIQRTPENSSREEVYEILALKHALSSSEMERRDLFWKGIVYYREQRWDEALQMFYTARPAEGLDGPVEFYIRRIEQLRDGLPQLAWTGRM